MHKHRAYAWVVVSLGLTWSAPAELCRAQTAIEAITRPSEDRTLSFVIRGLIAKMAIQDGKTGQVLKESLREGDAVKAGQVLARLDDKVEKAQADQLKAKAEDQIRIDAQKAKLDQAKVDHEKFQEAFKRGAATPLEVEHARLDVIIAELSQKLANFEQAQAKMEHEQKMLMIERMAICCPIDGVVEEIYRRMGESVNELEKVIRVVKIDPLWIDVPVPQGDAEPLKLGQVAKVKFPAPQNASPKPDDQGGVVDGKIIHIPAVGDAASATLILRVEVPNKLARRAGERVSVWFPKQSPSAGASAGGAAPGTPFRRPRHLASRWSAAVGANKE